MATATPRWMFRFIGSIMMLLAALIQDAVVGLVPTETGRFFMKRATRFSLLVFAPLYVAFLAPALLMLPTGVLVTLISLFDATVPAAESASYGIWILGPMLAVSILLAIGIGLHAPHARGRSHQMLWICIWAVFSVGLFVATWLGTTIVTSIGASDWEVGEFLSWTATLAALITLALQPGVGLWIYASSRVLSRVEPALRAER